jgi:alpha-1,3-glucan synthase
MMRHLFGLFAAALSATTQALIFEPAEVGFNLNENETAFDVLDYSGAWGNHTYQPSPDNWRFPIYSTFLDRFVNGDPVNDNANGTLFEQDLMSNQLRHGGDIKGLRDSLDYLQGTGAKVREHSGVFPSRTDSLRINIRESTLLVHHL